ncbi:unnamed protein product, partial [Clonostachys chloroleuca]
TQENQENQPNQEIQQDQQDQQTQDIQENQQTQQTQDTQENQQIQQIQEITIADGRFRIDYKIASGGYSRVYVGTDKKTNQQVAIKLEEVNQEVRSPSRGQETVKLEGRLYRKLPPHSYPKLHWTGTTRGGLYNALVTDLLGPSLWNLWEYCKHSFTQDTLCNIAIQALKRLQGLHQKGIIHNDVKPTNFAMGSGKNGNTLYLIDLGLATTFEEIKHREKVKRVGGLLGTAYYAPLEALRGKTRSYRDDLESLGLTLIELIKGELPWGDARDSLCLEQRAKITLDALCSGLPEVHFLIEHARNLRFDQLPNYRQLIKKFEKARSIPESGQTWIFDWVKVRYQRIQKKVEEQAAGLENRRRSRDADDEGEAEGPPRSRPRQQ